MGNIEAQFVFSKSDGTSVNFDFPRKRAAKLSFLYETVQVFVFVGENGIRIVYG